MARAFNFKHDIGLVEGDPKEKVPTVRVNIDGRRWYWLATRSFSQAPSPWPSESRSERGQTSGGCGSGAQWPPTQPFAVMRPAHPPGR